MIEILAVFLAVISGIAAHHEVHLVPAHVICPNVTSDHDILLPDPNDCRVYYRCEDGAAIPQSCPSGLAWCQILSECTLPVLANCTMNHTVVTYPPSPATPTPTTSPINPNICPEDGVTIPNPMDCSTYYECVNNTPVLNYCGDGEFYSCWVGRCVDSDIANCIQLGSQENKTCPKNGEKNVYPGDCGQFYECVDNKVEIKSCPTGSYFSQWYQVCFEQELPYCANSSVIEVTTDVPITTPTPSVPVNVCPFPNTTLPNPGNCSTYFSCNDSQPVLKQCPEGFQYSCWDKTCLPPVLAQCSANDADIGMNCTINGEKLPNSDDCKSFFECVNGTIVKMHCDKNLEYNQWFGECVDSESAHCEVTHTTVTITPHPATTREPVPNENICPIEGAKLPSATDCHSYYICTNNTPEVQTCPDNEEYSCWDQECLPPQSANCITGNQTNDACKGEGQTMPNIYDCSSYYMCINGSVALQFCNEVNTEFNQWFDKCVNSSESHCQQQKTTTTGTGEHPGTTTSSGENPGSTTGTGEHGSTTGTGEHPGRTTSSGENPGSTTSSGENSGSTTSSEENPGSTTGTGEHGSTTGTGEHPGTTTSSGENSGSTTSSEENSGSTTGTGEHSGITTSSGENSGSTTSSEENSGSTTGTGEHSGITTSSGENSGSTTSSEENSGSTTGTGEHSGITTSSGENSGSTTGTGEHPGTTTSSGENSGSTTSSEENPGSTTGTGEHGSTTGTGEHPGTTTSSGENSGSTTSSEENPGSTTGTGEHGSTTGTGEHPGTTTSSGENSGSTTSSEENPGSTTGTGEHGSTTGTGEHTGTTTSSGENPGSTTSSGENPGSTTGSTPLEPSENYTICPIENALLPNPVDCTTYYICKNNTPVLKTCPDGYGYSCWDQRCLPASQAQCISNGIQPGQNCTVDNLKLNSVESCGTYYECVNGTVVTHNCEDGTEYNAWFQKCVENKSSHCVTYTTLPPITSTLPKETITPSPVIDTCPFENALLPNPLNCSTYYRCINGTPTIQLCADGLEYSCWDEECLPSSQAQCIAVGSQEGKNCSKNGKQMQNPEDCHSYYKCVGGKVKLQKCSRNWYYNKWFGFCLPDFLSAHCHQSTTITTPSTTSTTLGPEQGRDICPVDGALLPDPLDCSSYYKCENNDAVHQTCPSGQAYSCWDQMCEDDSKAQCISVVPQVGTSCSRDGERLPNIEDCTSFYECDRGKVEQYYCFFGFRYNKWYGKCELFILAHCETYPTLPPISTNPTPTTISTISPGSNICPIEGALLPNPLDCTQYYMCQNNVPVAQKCPNNEEYSCWDQKCVESSEATCINGLQNGQNCSVNDERLPDIKDCRKYYACVNGKVKVQSCAEGQMYNKWFKACLKLSLAFCNDYPPPVTPTSSTGNSPTITSTISSLQTDITTINDNGTSTTIGLSENYTICPIENALLPNPVDCTTYYICKNNTPVLKTCPDGYGYSCWDQRCLPASQAQCISNGTQAGQNCTVDNLKLNSVESCGTYYECVNGTVVTHNCEDGTEYNAWFKKCVENKLSHCVTYTTLPPTTSTLPKETITPSPVIDTCPFENALLPNPLNCSTYYRCINGTPTIQLCADGLEYSCWDEECLPSSQAQCIAVGSQEGKNCSKNGKQMQNPEDCHSYYKCVDGKVKLQKCSWNWYYNKWFGFCLPDFLTAHCHQSTTITTPSTTSATHGPEQGRDICPVDGALLPDPLDCSSYYKCENNDAVHQTCPSGQAYSCWDQMCEDDSKAQCISVVPQVGTSCSRDGERLPNIEDCTSFYECDRGKVEQYYCFFGFRYNKWYGKCVLFIFAHCKTYPTLPPITTNRTPPTISTISPGSNICPIEGALLPNPLDCTQYYMCQNNVPVAQKCPNNEEYSCWDQKCVESSEATCINGLQNGQNCSVNDERLPDIKDCRKYYACVNGKVKVQSCAEGQMYNKWFKACLKLSLAFCNDYPPPVTPTSSTGNSPTTTKESTPSEYNICPIENALLPDPVHCSMYYVCKNETPVSESCPDGYGYSCWDQKCIPAEKADCISVGSQSGQNCSINNLQLNNVEDCSSYYVCVNGTVQTRTCLNNTQYNAWFNKCVNDDYSHCTPVSTLPATTSKSTIATPTPSPVTDICPVENALLPNPLNCSTYYLCINSTPTIQLCGDGLQYSCWDEECLPPGIAQCIAVGVNPGKECKQNGVRTPNPEDCHSYFQCVNGIITLKNCPNGRYYNKWFKRCLQSAQYAHCVTVTTIAPTPVPTTPPPSETNDICPMDGILLPDPVDCSYYFKCEKNKPIRTKCPDGQQYSCWDQTCEEASKAQCISAGSQLGANCSKQGVRLQDIQDCDGFYECDKGKADKKYCPVEHKYNRWYTDCQKPKYAHCKTYKPKPTKPPVTKPPLTKPTTVGTPITGDCPTNNVRIPNPRDCNSYYVCENKHPVRQYCGFGYLYDCWSKKCELAISATCVTEVNKKERCNADGETVPDVRNCKKYFQCKNGKVKEKKCKKEMEYSVWEQTCDPSSNKKCSVDIFGITY